ncbi:MAG: potassium transporter, partial [Pseudomonadota bacterium]
TCHAVIKANPERSVTLLQGAGTIFGNRTRALPEGLARYWRGHVLLRSFKEVSTRFDGTNEGDVFAFFREKYTISLDAPGERFMFGILSEEERDTIRGGLTALLNDYLADVIDDADDGTPVMITRTGERRALQHGTTVVNCTGHVLRHDRPYRPFLSPGGAILTITSRSAGHFLSSVSGYFLGHLFFAGQLQDAPLYEIDLDGARQLGPKLFHVAGTTHTFHNTAVIIGLLPFTVLDRCHLDLDRWFPLHRRLPIFLDVKLNRRRYIDQCRAALDRVRAERGLRCGPLAAA